MDEPFTVYHFRTDHEPVLMDYEHRGRVRLTVSCACGNRCHALSSGQAKHCLLCGILLSRVGQVITVTKLG